MTVHSAHADSFDLSVVGADVEYLRIASPWPPQLVKDTGSGASGYSYYLVRRSAVDVYEECGVAAEPVALMCEQGHLPELVLYGDSPVGPWLCSACHGGGSPSPTLEEMALRMAKMGVPAKGSTPPVRNRREAVLVSTPQVYDARSLGDGDPSLWAGEERLAKIIDAESTGTRPVRGVVLIFDYQRKTWEDRHGFVSWWPNVNVGCVQWVDTSWYIDDAASIHACLAIFNANAGP